MPIYWILRNYYADMQKPGLHRWGWSRHAEKFKNQRKQHPAGSLGRHAARGRKGHLLRDSRRSAPCSADVWHHPTEERFDWEHDHKPLQEKPIAQQAGKFLWLSRSSRLYGHTQSSHVPGPSSKLWVACYRAAGNHPHRQNRHPVTMVMIEDYERARWGQYLMATRGGGGYLTGAVGARGCTREQSPVGVDVVALIWIKDKSQDIKAKIPWTGMILQRRKS